MKRGFDMKTITEKKQKLDSKTAVQRDDAKANNSGSRYLQQPVNPEQSLAIFLTQARNSARSYSGNNGNNTKSACEIEARLGVLQVPFSIPSRRIVSSGAKLVKGNPVQAFDVSRIEPRASMGAGVSRQHFNKWTGPGLSEPSPLSLALGCMATNGSNSSSNQLKDQLVETEYTETVYIGYPQERRLVYPGEHPSATSISPGAMEYKEKLIVMDLTLPAAPYDLRITLSSEKVVDSQVSPTEPPSGWKAKRIKRRRSYTRRDKSMAWQMDVTEVTTIPKDNPQDSKVDYEIEMEIRPSVLTQLINEQDSSKVHTMAHSMAKQLWWIMTQMNPLHDVIDVEECLQDHPDKDAVTLALATCGALKHFVDRGPPYQSPIANPKLDKLSTLANVNFVGCMPVNFSRHNIEEIQRSPDNAYFLSEKTDGVRHIMVFTGNTVVLVDRAMRGKQPKPIGDDGSEPFKHLLDLIQPGTVLDGEVVMNRKQTKARPIFIVFDIMAINANEPVLHLPFDQRLQNLRRASFRTPTANRDMFDAKLVAMPQIALPLVRKNFVKRTQVDELLGYVVEEKGTRCYQNGDLHNHLTDGIIFQPNLPYVCGTDVHLYKWKYLDTVTIDVELLPLRHSDSDNVLRVGCMGEEQTSVDMTRHVLLPPSERLRMEADRAESGGRIAEVGFDPETGDWYYLTMRTDKIAPNHISTVLGTLMELGESLTTDELRYRMSVPAGTRDTYRKDIRGMLRQVLEHQRRQLRNPKPSK